ncbi:hypothetical protein N8894_01725 [Candidatus Pelagibacter sp.]|nr:hypothetical protein [Candidatus Pelagibacter sp.]
MKKLFFLFFLASCALPYSNNEIKTEIFDFNKNLTFDEFEKLLIKYAESNPYPSIDK